MYTPTLPVVQISPPQPAFQPAQLRESIVNFSAENYPNEVLSLTLFGVIEQPPEE
jgi:hypothetical protein